MTPDFPSLDRSRLCPTQAKSLLATAVEKGSELISVGITEKEGGIFVTVCLRDPTLGCQHITTQQVEALRLAQLLDGTLRLYVEASRSGRSNLPA